MTIVFHNKNTDPLLLCPLKLEALARHVMILHVRGFNIKQNIKTTITYSYLDKYNQK